jgi:hypothetical protein
LRNSLSSIPKSEAAKPIWAVEEIGKNSVSPSIMAIIMACSVSIKQLENVVIRKCGN